MLSLRYPLPLIPHRVESRRISNSTSSVVVCATKGPRPRYPRVWKTRKRIGTISKSVKLVDCIKGLSNVKEEVYGALDSFIAWELEFPLITVKKALKTLEYEEEWKRIIQVAKWMLSKGQGRTMGTYFTLLNALAEDGRLDEAEELWTKLFSENMESMPRMFFNKMIAIYYKREMHEKMFEVFADMEELGIKPNVAICKMVGNVFLKLGMTDKYEKLKKKYPPPKWEYRYIKGKRVKIRAKYLNQDGSDEYATGNEDTPHDSNESNNKVEETPHDSNESNNKVEETPHDSNESDNEVEETSQDHFDSDNEADSGSDELDVEPSYAS